MPTAAYRGRICTSVAFCKYCRGIVEQEIGSVPGHIGWRREEDGDDWYDRNATEMGAVREDGSRQGKSQTLGKMINTLQRTHPFFQTDISQK